MHKTWPCPAWLWASGSQALRGRQPISSKFVVTGVPIYLYSSLFSKKIPHLSLYLSTYPPASLSSVFLLVHGAAASGGAGAACSSLPRRPPTSRTPSAAAAASYGSAGVQLPPAVASRVADAFRGCSLGSRSRHGGGGVKSVVRPRPHNRGTAAAGAWPSSTSTSPGSRPDASSRASI